MTREDYGLMRRNISMEQLYNVAFVVLLCSLFFARLVFILFNFHLFYLNPVVFLALPYFSGLSLLGGVFGLFIGLGIVCYQKKYPWRKFFDFFSIAFACGLPVAAFGTNFLHSKSFFLPLAITLIFYVLMGILGIGVFYRRILVSKITDGVTTQIFLISISVAYLLQLFLRVYSVTFLKSPEAIGFLLLGVSQIVLVIIQFFRKRRRRV
jgi:hypothetical protein